MKSEKTSNFICSQPQTELNSSLDTINQPSGLVSVLRHAFSLHTITTSPLCVRTVESGEFCKLGNFSGYRRRKRPRVKVLFCVQGHSIQKELFNKCFYIFGYD